jgi:hypothetical protein
MKLKKGQAKLFRELKGILPVETLYQEIFGMTQQEARAQMGLLWQEELDNDYQVQNVFIEARIKKAQERVSRHAQ